MTTGIFTEVNAETPAPVVDAPKNTPDIPPELANIVGEGKKYASLADALNSIAPAQAHISVIEKDNSELRAKLAELEKASKSVDDVLSEIRESQVQSVETPAPSADSITDEVLVKLDERQAKQRATDNLQKTSDILTEKFGGEEKARKALADKAAELGLSVKDMMLVASKSVPAFLKYFDVTSTPNAPAPTGNINTDALYNQASSAPQPNTYEWFKAQRKEKGDAWYFSQAVVKQRTEAATKMGPDKFFGRTK